MRSAADPAHAPGSIIRDNQATIDLRRKPNREEWAFRPDFHYRAYQASTLGVDRILTTVQLPTGTARIPAFIVSASSGSAGTHTAPHPLPPREILVQRRFDDPAEALSALLADGPVLGLAESDTRALLARVGPTAGGRLPQQGVLNGFVREWLAAYVEVIGYEDGGVGVNYHFTIDYFHNSVTDRIVRDGVYRLDLTRRPTREELGFLEYQEIARVQPAWREAMSLRLRLPGGVLERGIDSVVSTDRQTDVRVGAGSAEQMRRILTEDAGVLGVDPVAVAALYAGTSGGVTTLPGRGTEVYGVVVRAQVNPGQPGNFAGGLNYVFSYRQR